MLTDSDGLAMLRENSIGHVVSKLSQIAAGTPGTRGVYTFLLGDGASRLNGAAELALHLLDGYPASALTTVFIFNNGRWAIEDNLIGPRRQADQGRARALQPRLLRLNQRPPAGLRLRRRRRARGDALAPRDADQPLCAP